MQLRVWRYGRCLLPLLFYAVSAHADNEDTFRQLHQGVQQHQQRQENRAIGDGSVSFGQGQANAGDNLMLALLQAINAYQGVEIRRLLARYQQQPDKDDDMVLFARANLAIIDDDLPGAIVLYRQLYQRNPQFLRGRLDLARLLFIDRQNHEARQLFGGLRIPGHPVIDQKIQGFIDALDGRSAWHGSVSAGPVYASNLNQSSEASVLRPQLSCEVDRHGVPILNGSGQLQCGTIYLPAAAPKSVNGKGLAYEMSFNKLMPLRGHYHLQLNAMGFGRWYRHESAYDEHNFYVNLDYLYQNKTSTFGLGPVYQASMFGQQLLVSSAGLDLNVSHELSPRAFAGFQAQHKYDSYRAPVYRRFNGPQTSVFTNLVYVLPDNWVIFGGYDYLRKSSQQRVDAYHRHGARLGLNRKFDWGMDATLQGSWRQTRYHDYNTWLQTRRHDRTQTWQLDVKLDRLALGKLTPVLSYKRINNHSSSWVNAYESDEWFLKLTYAF